MTSLLHRSTLPLLLICLGVGPLLEAEESIEAHIEKLADRKYSVRMEAKKGLRQMCVKNPELLDGLYEIVANNEDDIERLVNLREVLYASVVEAYFVERGSIGFALKDDMVVLNVVREKPAWLSGMRPNWKLIAVSGEPVEGKSPADVYAMVHATRPGTELDMEFIDDQGKKVLCQPKVAPRSTIRSDENLEERRQQIYAEWMERKQRELQTD